MRNTPTDGKPFAKIVIWIVFGFNALIFGVSISAFPLNIVVAAVLLLLGYVAATYYERNA